jgi:hypothetical protein
MTSSGNKLIGSAFVGLLLVAGCNQSPLASNADPQTSANASAKNSKESPLSGILEMKREITIPEGTVLAVTVDETLASNQNHSGDSFAASLAGAVVVDGKTAIPKGAHITGHVVEAKDAGRLHVPAQLSVALSSVEVDGKSYDIDTNTIGETGKNHNKRNLGFIGSGAAGGALIGGLAGGGKGAVIGSLLGAGAGTAGAAATGKKDISIPAETRLSFHLVRTITVRVKS